MLLGGGCGSGPPATPASSPDRVPPSLAGLPLTVAEVGDLELQVVIADKPGTRTRGLMGVAEFGLVDGMAFVFEAPTQTGFHMTNVLVPLDIAFIGPDGRVVDILAMPLCPAEPCPIFHAAAPFQWALETPRGGLDGIAIGDAFELR
jgi:hypothetical protein